MPRGRRPAGGAGARPPTPSHRSRRSPTLHRPADVIAHTTEVGAAGTRERATTTATALSGSPSAFHCAGPAAPQYVRPLAASALTVISHGVTTSGAVRSFPSASHPLSSKA